MKTVTQMLLYRTDTQGLTIKKEKKKRFTAINQTTQ